MGWVKKNPKRAFGAVVVVVVILLALWIAGVFDGKKTTTTTTTTPEKSDALPGAISDVQISMSGPDDDGATTEAYTSLEQMEGVSVTISFTTPESSFGYGTLRLKEYVISLGSSLTDGERGSPQLVITIPRNMQDASDIKMISAVVGTGTSPDGVTLSDGFNTPGQTVTITLGSDLWVQSEVVLDGKVYLGIDYTTMGETGAETPLDFSTATAGEPVKGTQSFLPNSDEGVSLTGDITDTGSFIINPSVQDSVNAALNIQITEGNVGGELTIRKTIGLSSRFLISPASDPTLYWGHPIGFPELRSSITGPGKLDSIGSKPTRLGRSDAGEAGNQVYFGNLRDPDSYYTGDSNWFNYAITEQRSDEWVRLALISNFENDPNATRPENIASTLTIIKDAQFPVLHQLSLGSNDDVISFADRANPQTWFKFVSPLDGSNSDGMSIIVRRVLDGGDADQVLGATLTTNDLFLARDGDEAMVMKLVDIADLQNAVFTKRQPVAGNAPTVEVADGEECDPSDYGKTEYGLKDELWKTYGGGCYLHHWRNDGPLYTGDAEAREAKYGNVCDPQGTRREKNQANFPDDNSRWDNKTRTGCNTAEGTGVSYLTHCDSEENGGQYMYCY